jgi:hypothetical protein
VISHYHPEAMGQADKEARVNPKPSRYHLKNQNGQSQKKAKVESQRYKNRQGIHVRSTKSRHVVHDRKGKKETQGIAWIGPVFRHS